ncbi:MAG: sulfatase [Cyclobacteriaceae bacterium]|nr:sulfatase [Cyclobacteriaceae bacterium]
MKNTLYTLGLLIMLVSCSKKTETENKEALNSIFQPNILWLVAEDLSPYIPVYGDSSIQTPTLSRLAEEGVIFTNVYSPSGVCSPSRYALSTGRYPISDGADNMRNQNSDERLATLGLISYEVVPPPEVKMMSQVLRENGYFTSNNAKEDYQYAPVVTAWDERGNKAHWRNRKPGQPFFSVFNFEITHESQFFTPDGRGKLRYFLNEPFIGENGVVDSTLWNYSLPDSIKLPVPPYLQDTEVVQKDLRTMYRNIQIMDRQVQVVLNQLEEDGLLDSTIVIWYSDHGGPLPRQKRLMYESGLKVPMIIRYPEKLKAGTSDDQLISFLDFAPTMFSYAGIQPPDYLQGFAFDGPFKEKSERRYIHAASDRLDEHYDRIRAVKDERYKYIRNYYPDKPYYLPLGYRENIPTMQELLRMNKEGLLNEAQAQWFRQEKPMEELFDTWEDPHELNNLVENPDYGEILVRLREECNIWINEVGDYGNIPEKDILEKFWPERKQPVCQPPTISKEGEFRVITCSDPGCVIGYQLVKEGEEPGKVWYPYTQPVSAVEGIHIVAIADRIGWAPSEWVKK